MLQHTCMGDNTASRQPVITWIPPAQRTGVSKPPRSMKETPFGRTTRRQIAPETHHRALREVDDLRNLPGALSCALHAVTLSQNIGPLDGNL